MKALLFAGIFLYLAPIASAQYDYQLELNTATYQEKSGGDLAYNGSNWGGYSQHPISLGFPFTFMDTLVTDIILEATGRILFSSNHSYWLDMTTVANFQSKSGINSSPIRIHKNTLLDGSKSVSIQYTNATYTNDTSKTINFRITLYEKDNSIELHMGPRDDVSGSNAIFLGPYLGYYHSSNLAQANFDYGRNWVGDLATLKDTIFTGVGANFLDFTLRDIIPTDQIIRLKPVPSLHQKEIKHSKFSALFNSQDRSLKLENPEQLSIDLRIYTTAGKLIHQQKSLSKKTELSFLKQENYLFVFSSSGKLLLTEKIYVP